MEGQTRIILTQLYTADRDEAVYETEDQSMQILNHEFRQYNMLSMSRASCCMGSVRGSMQHIVCGLRLIEN